MNHTPGPWQADDGDVGDWGVFGPDQQPIAYLLERSSHDGSVSVGVRPNDEANAKLIAAAPDLLQALRGFLELAFDSWEMTEDDPEVERALAVIKQATGEDQ